MFSYKKFLNIECNITREDVKKSLKKSKHFKK